MKYILFSAIAAAFRDGRVKALGLVTIAGCLMAMSETGLAQPDSPDCNVCWDLVDDACDASQTCSSAAGDVVTTFSAPCTDNYKFECKNVKCDQSICHNCITCAKLTDTGTGQVWTCTTVLDQGGHCESGCYRATNGVPLVQNHVYEFRVGLHKCDVLYCTLCDCKAEARVYVPTAACPAW